VFDPAAAELPDVLEEAANNGGGQPLFVGNVYHKSVIEEKEEGTEAVGSMAVTTDD
jgi:serine protease inhibitor